MLNYKGCQYLQPRQSGVAVEEASLGKVQMREVVPGGDHGPGVAQVPQQLCPHLCLIIYIFE